MIFVKMLEPVNGKDYALWKCGRCNQPPMRLGYKIGRNRGECYQCEQRIRERESTVAVYRHKDTDVKIRECLMCGFGFESKGIWNRLCSTCSGSTDYIEEVNNLKAAKHDAVLQLVGDYMASEESIIRGMVS